MIDNMFTPQIIPPRKFIEYSYSAEEESQEDNSKSNFFVGLNPTFKKAKAKKNVRILDISKILYSQQEDSGIDNEFDNFSMDHIFIQKAGIPPQEVLNNFSTAIDSILTPDIENNNHLFSSLIDLQSLRNLASDLATRSFNTYSSLSLLPLNSDKQNSNTKLMYDSYYLISNKLKLFSVNFIFKEHLSAIETISELGQLYKNCEIKVNAITNTFSGLCQSKLNLNLDFRQIFHQTIHDIFVGVKTIANNNALLRNSGSSHDLNMYIFESKFNGFESDNSNGFNDAFGMFSEAKGNSDDDTSDITSAKFTIDIDFDGEILYEKVCGLIIHYYLDNVIKKNIFSTSLRKSNQSKSDDLTSFYYNINNEGPSGESKNGSNDNQAFFDDIDFNHAFQFVKITGNLYERKFISMLIDSIIEEYDPVITQLFEKSYMSQGELTVNNLTVYFKDIKQIEAELDQSLHSISHLISDHTFQQIKHAFIQIAFASKLEEMCKNGLRLLVQRKDIKTIELCAEYAKSTNIIEKFAHELSFDFESVVSDCFKARIEDEDDKTEFNPIHEAIDYLKMLNQLCKSSFNEKMSKMLIDAFKKGLNVIPDQAARLLAEEVNFQFLHLPSYTSKLVKQFNNSKSQDDFFSRLSFINDFICIFKYLTCKDVFEAYHHLYLSRRILMLKASVIRIDEYFAKLLCKICGEEYSKRIDIIFNDLHNSSRILHEFQEEGKKINKVPPMYFKTLVLDQTNWITNVDNVHRTPIEAPHEVSIVLSNFVQFYLSRNPGKQIEWNHHLSRVKLSVKNPNALVKEIQCNGIAATILCLFNNIEFLTKKDMMDWCKCDEKVIDECIKILKSKKNGRLLKSSKSEAGNGYVVDLNSSLINVNGVVKLPFIKMIVPRHETENAIMHIGESRANVIDANIMLIMKREHSMNKDKLKEIIKGMIQFRLDNDLFEKELENLSRKLYLRIDPSGRVHYLP